MTHRSHSLFLLSGLLFASINSLAGSVITIDENGHGTVDAATLPYTLGTDPNPAHVPGQKNVLIYGPLPFSGTAGDVNVFIGATPGAIIRFNADKTIIFYAAANTGQNDNSLATQVTPPIPPFPVTNTARLTFTSTLLTYTPTTGQPGYDPSGPTYIFMFANSPMVNGMPALTGIVNPVGSNLESAFQITYASNLNLADGVINIVNSGSASTDVAPSSSNVSGAMCINAYVYQPNDQLLACCTCPASPNSLHSWPVIYGTQALLANAPTKPNSVVIKLVATQAGSTSTPTNIVCDPTFQNAPFALVPGLTALSTRAHPTNTNAYAITETPFKKVALSTGEGSKLQSDCMGLPQATKLCPACTTGGLAIPAPDAIP